MEENNGHNRFQSEHWWAILVLLILVVYTYPRFFVVPYLGFDFDGSGRIATMYVDSGPGGSLRAGDVLIQLGDRQFAQYKTDVLYSLNLGFKTGQTVPVQIQRDGQVMTVFWKIPGQTRGELINRVVNLWWLGYFFWIFGTLTLLLIRPKDERWILLIAFFYLTSFYLITGTSSIYHVWGNAMLMHMAIWMSVPVYWHLHWLFPMPLRKIPKYAWGLLYLAGIAAAIAEALRVMPFNAYFIGFILAMTGSVILLLVHSISYPMQRRDINMLALAVGLAILPPVIVSISIILNWYPWFVALGMMSLFVLPGAYFYVVYRGQLGGMQLRMNRAILGYMYAVLVLSSSLLMAAATLPIQNSLPSSLLMGALLFSLGGLGSAVAYPRFQRWAERNLLGMPMPPTKLVETYMARITTSLDASRLAALLRDEVLPSLLIRQAALIRLESIGDGNRPVNVKMIFHLGVPEIELPRASMVPTLLTQSGRPRRPSEREGDQTPCPWARLILPLTVGQQVVGLFLFGRRDPDDLYTPTEAVTLQVVMDQTALALVNIEQAERLHAFYQNDIERNEAERTALARELHDTVLGQLGVLSVVTDGAQPSPAFAEAYQETVTHIRDIISGLRPTMLNFGLQTALSELVDETQSHVKDDLQIDMTIPAGNVRYSPDIELHLYRIVQQACQNAIRHAQASHICIQGFLEHGQTEIIVEDDGKGFEASGQLDLGWLLANKHFGLAGMYERAAIIGANLQIDSTPQQGTRVRILWKSSDVRTRPLGQNNYYLKVN